MAKTVTFGNHNPNGGAVVVSPNWGRNTAVLSGMSKYISTNGIFTLCPPPHTYNTSALAREIMWTSSETSK